MNRKAHKRAQIRMTGDVYYDVRIECTHKHYSIALATARKHKPFSYLPYHFKCKYIIFQFIICVCVLYCIVLSMFCFIFICLLLCWKNTCLSAHSLHTYLISWINVQILCNLLASFSVHYAIHLLFYFNYLCVVNKFWWSMVFF